jgi:putative ABC transport system substrate-binding protein
VGSNFPPSGPAPRVDGLRQGLADRGYVEGQNIVIEYRWAEGRIERLPALVQELVALPVDVIVAPTPLIAKAAGDATTTIPIVMAAEGDPVSLGLVASFAHPGGNLTGVSNMATELSGKRLELLKQVVPGATHVAVLWNSNFPAMTARFQEIQAAAAALSVQVEPLRVERPEDFAAAFEQALRTAPDALIVTADPFTSQNQRRVLDFAAEQGVPAMYEEREWATAGGLMAYGPSVSDQSRRAAGYVDRILKGTKPGELPIDQAMVFDFVINLKTAQALGLTIPQHVLLQATEVIQ